jgi:hypothetical protein
LVSCLRSSRNHDYYKYNDINVYYFNYFNDEYYKYVYHHGPAAN